MWREEDTHEFVDMLSLLGLPVGSYQSSGLHVQTSRRELGQAGAFRQSEEGVVRKRDELQEDHRRARQVVLMAGVAPVGPKDAQVRIHGGTLSASLGCCHPGRGRN